jgi:hypothetical protein
MRPQKGKRQLCDQTVQSGRPQLDVVPAVRETLEVGRRTMADFRQRCAQNELGKAKSIAALLLTLGSFTAPRGARAPPAGPPQNECWRLMSQMHSAPVFQRPLRHADCFQVHMRSRVSDRVVGDAEDGEKRGGAQRDARAPCIGKAVWPDWTWPRRGTGAWMWNWTREQQFMASPSTAPVRSSGVFAAPFRTAHFA